MIWLVQTILFGAFEVDLVAETKRSALTEARRRFGKHAVECVARPAREYRRCKTCDCQPCCCNRSAA